jgi:hypothetical protein
MIDPKKTMKSHSGQVAVEYILLLMVGIGIWLLLVNGLVSRNSESPGAVTAKWNQIIQMIGSDAIEK